MTPDEMLSLVVECEARAANARAQVEDLAKRLADVTDQHEGLLRTVLDNVEDRDDANLRAAKAEEQLAEVTADLTRARAQIAELEATTRICGCGDHYKLPTQCPICEMTETDWNAVMEGAEGALFARHLTRNPSNDAAPQGGHENRLLRETLGMIADRAEMGLATQATGGFICREALKFAAAAARQTLTAEGRE